MKSICASIFFWATVFASDTAPATPVCKACLEDVSSLRSVTETPWLEPAARHKLCTQKYFVTDQDGKRVAFDELFGQPIALTFLYTRCDNPNKCPLAASTAARLQTELRKAGLDQQVRLLVMTYDPEYDSPAVLRQYAASKNIQCDEHTQLLRPEPSEKAALFKELNLAVNFNADRVNIHGLQMLLIDKQGALARAYRTVIWDNAKVLDDLKKLVAEPACF